MSMSLRIRLLAPLTLALAARGQAPAPIPAPLGQDIQELGSQSSWAQDARFEGERPDKSKRGVYPIGNGLLFGYCGLGARANTLQGITGPGYQTDEDWAPKGHFGELTLELWQAGAAVALPEQRLRRVRGAGFVVTEDAGEGLALRTLTFAAPDQLALTRVIEVENRGPRLAGVVLRAGPEGPLAVAGDTLVKTYTSRERPARAAFALSGGRPRDGRLEVELGELAQGARWTGVLTISTHRGEAPPAEWAPSPPDLAQATRDARSTLAWWRAKLAATAYFETDHRKLNDLVLDWKVMLLAQRDARSGAVAPMVSYRGAWVRDSVGPLLLFLRFNLWDEARALLRYFFQATRLLGRVPNHVPLDLDFAPLADRATDWNAIEVPDSEVPSWIILQHLWYWRVTQDHALLREHWPLLEACLKKQKRGADSLMTFHGDETWLHGAFYSLYPGRIGDGSGCIAEDAWSGRRTWSLASGVQFLIALNGIGEMLNGLDRAEHPERWSAGPPKDAPGQRYVDRAFAFMADIEKRYWLPDVAYFAPAISPVTEEPHRLPYADVNLTPLWVGWTFPTGEKSKENLKGSLARLWQRGVRIGMTPSVGWSTGLTHGQLLLAFAERDAKERLELFDELLRMAEPAGEWGELYDPDGRPQAAYQAEWPNRCRPWESGVNLDALLYAICGIRFNTVPNWDNTDIRAKLRMPNGATFVTMKDIKKDGRHLHLFMETVHRPLDDKEREENEKKKPEERRDPARPHQRLHFRLELLSPLPQPRGYWDVGVNAMNTMFVRYFFTDKDGKEHRVVDETEFWYEDKDPFLPQGVQGPAKEAPPRARGPDADLLVLTARTAGAEIAGKKGVTVLDTGLPSTVDEIAALLLDGAGQPLHRTLYLDWAFDDPGRTTFKTAAFWQDPAWTRALAAFRAAGGQVLAPGYFTAWEVEAGGTVRTVEAVAGRLEAAGASRLTARFASDTARDAVLRIGSSCGLEVVLDGQSISTREGGRHPLPDQDALLVRLVQGDHVLELRPRGGETPVVWARISDARGLPVPGVRQ